MISQHTLQQFAQLAESPELAVAALADVMIAVCGQWQDHALDSEDFGSIVERNLVLARAFAATRDSALLVQTIEDLL